MKQTLVTIFCFVVSGLLISCNTMQEIVATNPKQNASAQSTVKAELPEPKPSPLTEKDIKRRAEVHKLMLKGKYLHDGSLELAHIGDISSVPALLVVLKENPPYPNGAMVCTSAHALHALRKITGENPGIKYEDWSAWWGKYQEAHK